MSQRRAKQGSRAAVYARVSHREQKTVRDQIRKCREFAKFKGWVVGDRHVFKDEGISGWSGKDRPGWLSLERAVDAREVDAVIVFQISRAARNTGRLYDFLKLCRERDVEFVSANEGLDTSTPMGRMMVTVIGALAELESEIKSERVLQGLGRKRELGEWIGGRIPYGFRQERVKGNLVSEQREAKLIQEAASRFLAGQGLQTIAKDWNKRGIKTKRTGVWSATTLRNVLMYPEHKGVTLTHKDFDRVGAKLDQQAAGITPRGDRYLLTSLLRCGACEQPMVGQPKEGIRRYICNKGPHDTVIRADDVEAIVRNRVASARLEVEDVADPDQAPEKLRRKLVKAEEELRKAAREASETGVEPGVLREYLRSYVERRDAVQHAVDEATPRAKWSRARWWDLPDTEPERGDIEQVVDHVTIAPARSVPKRPYVFGNGDDDWEMRRFPEDRVDITWKDGVEILP